MKRVVHRHETEAALCEAFLETVPVDWTAYPEAGGFDIVLLHNETGVQIGIEAKLRLNAKVICQAIAGNGSIYQEAGPDYRAVLVPMAYGDLRNIAHRLGLTVLTVEKASSNVIYGNANQHKGSSWLSMPRLPSLADYSADRPGWLSSEDWHDFCPISRLSLPEYVPDVSAGCSAPLKLTDWKIQAMKVCILIERVGSIHRHDFKKLRISPTMWTQGSGWLAPGPVRGWWVRGPNFPADSYRRQHPTIYPQVEADFDEWVSKAALDLTRPEQAALDLQQ